jgi:AraC-like DNA-binding protein
VDGKNRRLVPDDVVRLIDLGLVERSSSIIAQSSDLSGVGLYRLLVSGRFSVMTIKNTHRTTEVSQHFGQAGLLTALATDIARLTEQGGQLATAIPGLSLYRREAPTQPVSHLYEPSICVIAQGVKRVVLGDEVYDYDGQHVLITSVDLPTIVQVTKASRDKPYLSLLLQLDRRALSQLLVESRLPPARLQPSSRGIAIGEATVPLLAAFQRLVALLGEPQDIPILAPMVQREILYRLLMSGQGVLLRQLAVAGSQSQQIARAIGWLKQHFMEPVRIEDLAGRANMSPSTFHHHFRSVTSMSPLQYQKWLRLNEARRLMLTERLDATSAAFQVGYESSSQFSREYRRSFGAPPLRDIAGLRACAGDAG